MFVNLFMKVRISSVQKALSVSSFPASPSPLVSILVPSVCILFQGFQIIVLTACGVPTVLKYVLQSKRFHGCQSAVERFLPKTAEAITRCKCRNLQKVMRFLDSGKETSADILTLTFGESYENLQLALGD